MEGIEDLVLDSDGEVFYAVRFVGFPHLYATIAPCISKKMVTSFNMKLLETRDDCDGWLFPELRKTIAAYENVTLDAKTLLPAVHASNESDDESDADTTCGDVADDGAMEVDEEELESEKEQPAPTRAERTTRRSGTGALASLSPSPSPKKRCWRVTVEHVADVGRRSTSAGALASPVPSPVPSPVRSPKKRARVEVASRVTRSCALSPGMRLRGRK